MKITQLPLEKITPYERNPRNADAVAESIKAWVDVFRRRLIDSPVRLAFVFGSLAAGAGGSQNDIDLMVIGSAGFRDVVKLLSGCSNALGREVNPHVFSPKEFNARRKWLKLFNSTVLRSPRLFVIRDDVELGAMG